MDQKLLSREARMRRIWLVKWGLLFLIFCVGCSGSSSSTTGGSGGTGGTSGSGGTPILSSQMTTNGGEWDLQLPAPTMGSITFGTSQTSAPSADDGHVVRIVLEGNAALTSSDRAGPTWANQISTHDSPSFGAYRARVKVASCTAGEEIVNGIFLYSNDGTDTNPANGLIDNNEIDIEIPCSHPNNLFLTSWTDYTDDTHLRKVTRMIDLQTGEYFQTPVGQEGTYNLSDTPTGTLTAIPDFLATSGFYEMGFDWHTSSLRFFIVVDGTERTLWTIPDGMATASLIPQNPASFMFNVWHSSTDWITDAAADYPHSDAVMDVDWFRYWAD